MHSRSLLVALFLLALAATPAQPRALIASQIQPSVRATAMGGASTAFPWGTDPDPWANPALIAQTRGLQAGWLELQSEPVETRFADFRMNWWSARYLGIGIHMVGWPGAGESGATVDFGTVAAKFPDGSTGRIPLYFKQRSLGVGVNILELRDALQGRVVEGPRRLEVSLGYAFKQARDDWTVDSDLETTLHDVGVLVQGQLWPPAEFEGRSRVRIEAAAGAALLNLGHGTLEDWELNLESGKTTTLQSRRLGLGIQMNFWEGPDEDAGWRSRLVHPLVELNFALDRGSGVESTEDSWNRGAELRLFQLLSLWTGKATVGGDPVGSEYMRSSLQSWGVGAGVELDGIGGFQLRRAVEEASGAEVFRGRESLGATIWVDVVGLVGRR